jgi:flagellar motor switch protein FliM
MAEADKILSQHEVDALLLAIDSGTAESASDVSEERYDFRCPSRVPSGQLRFLHSIHEGYARSLQTALSGLLLCAVETRLVRVHQMSLRGFLGSLPNPTLLVLLSAEPLEGNFLLGISPSIGYPIIERLLGAGKITPPRRDRLLSSLEWNVADTFVNRVLEVLQEAWAAVAPVRFKALRRENDPGAFQFENIDEPTVLITLEIGLGDQHGTLDIAFPAMALEPHFSRMIAATPFSSRKRECGVEQGGAISIRLGPAEVQVKAILQVERLSLKDLEGLRPGDILVTNQLQGSPLIVTVEGRPKFQARLGGLKDRKAIKIVAVASEQDPSAGRASLSVFKGDGAGGPPSGYMENLLHLPLAASVVLAEKAMRVREVMGFKVGDVIGFPQRADEPLELRVAHRRLAHGSCVQIGDVFGLRITAILAPQPSRRGSS